MVEVDIEGFFDTIDHELLRRLVARRISDRRVFKLLRQWLTVGVVEEGQWHPTTRGSPQGGVISPVLATIYWPVLARYWTQPYRALGHLTRYADDRLIVCRTRGAAEQARQAVTQVWQKLKRTVHPTKTRIVDVKSAGCELLGFHFHQGRARTSGQLIPLMWPGQKAMKAIRRHIREQTERRGLRGTLTAIVAKLNPIIRGWRNYFRVGHSTKTFQDLDRYVRQRVGQWERARLQRAATAGHTPGPAPHPWTRILLSARKMRYATLNASGRRLSESRMRENRTYGLRWRGLDTWPRWHGEPTPPSKERDWKPSTSSRRASPRPYQATALQRPLCALGFRPRLTPGVDMTSDVKGCSKFFLSSSQGPISSCSPSAEAEPVRDDG